MQTQRLAVFSIGNIIDFMPGMKKKKTFSAALLAWWDQNRREMPWRAKKGNRANPYHVLLSEFMLQQTQVSTVIPYFRKFIRRFPSLPALARARLDEVRRLWAGLGYYARARNLQACAVSIIKKHGGRIPQDEISLQALPGIGPYTAAAIAAIAYHKPANVVDSNVKRVMARFHGVAAPLPSAAERLTALASTHVPQKRAGDYAQALMDLGATLCTPRNPQCGRCPVQGGCRAYQEGRQEKYPVRRRRKKPPSRHAIVFVVTDGQGRVLLRQRPEKGLLGGMWEFPSTPWGAGAKPGLCRILPPAGGWKKLEAPVIHVFSHFRLYLTLHIGRFSHRPSLFSRDDSPHIWKPWRKMGEMALPSVMRKVANAAKPHLGFSE